MQSHPGNRVAFLISCGVGDRRGEPAFAAGEPTVAEAEEGFFHDEVEEPAAEQGDADTDPETHIAVVGDAAGAKKFVGEVDELFMGEVDGVGEGGGSRPAKRLPGALAPAWTLSCTKKKGI